MASIDWTRVRSVFEEALNRPEAERDAFLVEACGGNEELRAEVASLLAADAREHPALDRDPDERAADDPFSLEGREVGPYRILESIGEGGMGAVYLAERADGQFDQQVALKLLRPGMASDRTLQRFSGERQILARLEHPGIARLVDGGVTSGGRPWFAMEYVDGRPLDAWCDEHQLSVEERLRLFLSVCDAVRYAHARLIIHRDLKPGNILVVGGDGRQARVKLLDFGIAKLLEDDRAGITVTGAAPLTPAYAAPEQLDGTAVSTATDVYSLGVILFELLTGHRPYAVDASSPGELAQAIRTASPERPSAVVSRDRDPTTSQARRTRPDRLRRRLAGDLDVIVLKALRKEPERRYVSVEALQDDVRRHLDGRPVNARPDTVGYRTRKFVARNRGTVMAGTAFVVSVLFFGVSSVLQAVQLERERDAARLERDRAQAVSDFLVEVFQASDPRQTLGADVSARELLDRGAERIMETDAMDPAVRATLMATMGEVYAWFSLAPEAVPLFEAALQVAEDRWESPHPELAEARTNLAVMYAGLGDFERGLPMLEESVRELDALGAEASPLQLAGTLNQAGNQFMDAARYEEAQAYFDRALAVARADSTVQAEIGASLTNNLGQLAHHTGRFEDAVGYHREALATREARLDSLHPDVLNSMNNLAIALERTGRFAEAAEIHEELIARGTRVFGETPPLALYLNNAATTYKRLGRPAEAEPLQRRALAIFREHSGEESPLAALATNNLANILHDQGRPAEAVEMHRRALALRRTIYGEDHDQVAGSLNNLAAALQDLGEFDEALELYRETLAMDKRVLGDRHPFVAQDYVNLAGVFMRRGRAGDIRSARAHIDSAAVLQEENLPQDNLAHPKRLATSARIYLEAGQLTEAETDARRAVELNEAAFPDGSAQLAYSRAVLGAVLAETGRLRQAGSLLRGAHARLEADLGPDARDTRLVAGWLAEWDLWEEPGSAAGGPATEGAGDGKSEG